MKDWFDTQQLVCVICRHRWVLVSDKQITQQQHQVWIRKVMEHHEKIRKERGGK